METIYNSIRKEILNHSKVRNSILDTVHQWKRSQYIILAQIISQDLSHSKELQNERKFELGNSISHITLQRFFENEYKSKTHNDLRFLKTLDKICIFLGHKDLNSYIQFKKENSQNLTSQNLNTDIIPQYCDRAFELYCNFPQLKIEIFEDLIFENSPFYERIHSFAAELCQKKLELITKNNRSNFEVYDIKMVTDEENKKIIECKEFWNLLFRNKNNGEEYFVNQLTTQIYFIKFIDGKWKIWDNYNPDAGLLNNKLKKP